MVDFSVKEKNLVGRGENAGHHHFLLLPQYNVYSKAVFLRVVKTQDFVGNSEALWVYQMLHALSM